MTEAALRLEGVSKSFAGVAALNDVSFSVPGGCIASLIGPNGAGKTTLLNIISGIVVLDRGRLTFRGRDLRSMPPHRVARLGIGRTFQHLQLFENLTVLENVLVGMDPQLKCGVWGAGLRARTMRQEERAARERAEGILAQTGLLERANYQVSALSFLERRFLELTSALAGRPSLLLLDEPAAGLSDAEGHLLVERLRAFRAVGLTLLLVEHHMPLVMSLSDVVVVLNHGIVIAEGPPAAIQRDPKVIAAYLG